MKQHLKARTLAAVAVGVVALLTPLAAPATAGPAHQIKVARAATEGFTHTDAAKKAGYGLLKDAASPASP